MAVSGKMIKKLIITAAALLLLGGAYVLAMKWEPDNGETESVADIPYVFHDELADIVSVRIVNEQSDYTMIRSDEGEVSIAELEGMDVVKEDLAAAFAAFVKMNASKVVTKELERMEEYGLVNPREYCILTRKDHTTAKILIGDEVPTGGEYYCMLEGEDTIYAVSAKKKEYMGNSPDAYRNPLIYSIGEIGQIKSFTVWKAEEMVLQLRGTTEEEHEESLAAESWILEYPWKEYALDESLKSLLTHFVELKAMGFVQEHQKINFDYQIALSTADKNYVMSVGQGTDSAGGTYLRDELTSQVYVVEKGLWDTLENMDPNDYISRFVWLAYIRELSRITVATEAGEFVMEPGDGAKQPYRINGKDAAEEHFKSQFTVITGLTFKERTDCDVQGSPYMTITYEYLKGRVASVQLYEYDDRHFVAVRSDGTKVMVTNDKVKAIEAAIGMTA